MRVINLASNDQYYNINSLSGYALGAALVLTSYSSSVITLVRSPTQPVAGSDSYPLRPNESVIIASGEDPVWAKGGNGDLIVQSTGNIISPAGFVNPRVLVGLEGFTTQSFTEANCKNGTQFELTTFDASFVNATNRDFVVVTGDKPILIKNRLFDFTGTQLTTNIYRNPTYTGGTSVPYYNLSTMNPVAGEAQILFSPTVTNVGTQIAPTRVMIGSQAQGGNSITTTHTESSVVGLERVLAPNSVFLFRTTNTSGANMSLSSVTTWYEGDLSSRVV